MVENNHDNNLQQYMVFRQTA